MPNGPKFFGSQGSPLSSFSIKENGYNADSFQEPRYSVSYTIVLDRNRFLDQWLFATGNASHLQNGQGDGGQLDGSGDAHPRERTGKLSAPITDKVAQ